MRTTLIAGNWKMNGDKAMARAICENIVAGARNREENDAANAGNPDILLCPPFTLLSTVSAIIRDSVCQLGAQDMAASGNGAFTGQISSTMLLDCGCSHVILGHSERRALCGESDQMVADKTGRAVSDGLVAILCVGETRSERESGATGQVVQRQVQTVIDTVGIGQFRNIVIAYEPVWAIGTGLSATPQQAWLVHQLIRRQLARHDADIAEGCRILYGGSMKPDNASELLAGPDIDGGLIGGAALKAKDFLCIYRAALAIQGSPGKTERQYTNYGF